MANLTDDADNFVRRQELIEAPKAGVPTEALTRSMALRAAEKFLGKDAGFRDGRLFVGEREIPTDDQRTLTINYAGPANTFPTVSLFDFIQAVRSGNRAQLAKWVEGKIVLLGPDNLDDRHATPFFTAFSLSDRWMTPGVEIHANTLRTRFRPGDFLKPVPEWARITGLVATAAATVAVTTSFAAGQTALGAIVVLALALISTHVLFGAGSLLSTTELALGFIWALVGGVDLPVRYGGKEEQFLLKAPWLCLWGSRWRGRSISRARSDLRASGRW